MPSPSRGIRNPVLKKFVCHSGTSRPSCREIPVAHENILSYDFDEQHPLQQELVSAQDDRAWQKRSTEPPKAYEWSWFYMGFRDTPASSVYWVSKLRFYNIPPNSTSQRAPFLRKLIRVGSAWMSKTAVEEKLLLYPKGWHTISTSCIWRKK